MHPHLPVALPLPLTPIILMRFHWEGVALVLHIVLFYMLNIYTIDEYFNHYSTMKCGHIVVQLSGLSILEHFNILNKLCIYYTFTPLP